MTSAKKRALAIAGAVLIFLIGFWFGGRKAVAPEMPPAASLPVSIVSVHDATAPLYKLSIEYPQFTSLPDGFNASIKNFVDSGLADFKQMVQENWDAREATLPSGTPAMAPQQIYYYDITWEPAQLNAHYVSFVLRLEEFIGGANENDDMMTFNYDLAKNAPITLADLFPNTPDYLDELSKIASDQLTATLNSNSGGNAPADMIAQGTAPTADNFQNFTFTDDVLTIYFPKYQVAPGVFGEQQVLIPWSGI